MHLLEGRDRKPYPQILVGDDDDVPGLAVAGARRRARAREDVVDILRVERFSGVVPDRRPRLEEAEEIRGGHAL